MDGLSAETTKKGRLQRACLVLLREHEADGALPTSIRFLFYELVGRGTIPKAYRKPDGTEGKRKPSHSMCENVGGCRKESPMVTWLKDDLAANADEACTLAYFHHPLFSSGPHGNQTKMRPTWRALYRANAEVVISAHDHVYERFAPQTPDGEADSTRGIREFVVGTGGRSHYSFGTITANSEVRNSDTFGVLKLTLHPRSYDWQFVPVAGQTFTDSGTTLCH